MSRQINFEDFKPKTEILQKRNYREEIEVSEKCADSFVSYDDPGIKAEMELLLRIQPGKINYNQQEVADAIGMSYQFVNRACKKGRIKTVTFGDKNLITIYELARIIKEGVKYGN